MQRVTKAIPRPSSNTYNQNNKRPYTRFHRKPQIYQTTLKQENINEYINNIYKEKKYQSILDPTAPNNKNIFLDTDSDIQKTDKNSENAQKELKNSTNLLIAKTESQFPETYNSQNVFRRDGLVKGYYIKVNEKKNLYNINSKYNTNSNKIMIKTIVHTPSQVSKDKNLKDYNIRAQTQIREKIITNINLLNQTYNRNNDTNNTYFRQVDLDEWPPIDKDKKSGTYGHNKNYNDISNDKENQNINIKNQKRNFPIGIVYNKRNISEKRHSYSKSNASDVSEDIISQYKKPKENDNIYETKNYMLEENISEIASPLNYKNTNDFNSTSEKDSDKQVELIFSNNTNTISNDQGGKVDLYYDNKKHKNDIVIKTKKIIIKKNKNINAEDIIKNDISKFNLLIKLQRFIKSYLYLRELCAMKIQAVWRGVNTRKIMDLYNDLDEFIYHLSKVQFNHFNNDFCFFIKQIFNIYKAKMVKESNESDNIEILNINEEEENEDENENCMNQISIEEEIGQKESIEKLSYKFPDVGIFASDKLEQENEIDLFVQGSTSPYYERKIPKKTRDYDRLKKDYDNLYQQYNELLSQKSNSININKYTNPRIDKNKTESAIGSYNSDYKFNKIDKFGINSKDNKKSKKTYSELRKTDGENLTISNDYDADLDINRDDDEFFNKNINYDDKENSGSPIKEQKYSYFSIHSDENSKYFDNENPKKRKRENKEKDIYKINISKNSVGSRFNNSSKVTGCSSRQGSKLVTLRRYENIKYSRSPSYERSDNYMGYQNKTFPKKYNNDSYNNNILIIPKHEEHFNIINTTNSFSSPRERSVNKINNKNGSDIAIIPTSKIEDKKWNEINEFMKNEELEILTQKCFENHNNKIETKEIATEVTSELYSHENKPFYNEHFYISKSIKNKEPLILENNVAKVNISKKIIYKKPKKLIVKKIEQISIEGIKKEETSNNIFNILEKEKINEIIIDNKENLKNKINHIYIEHENEINIKKNKDSIEKIKSFEREIENKNNENILLKKELEEIKNKPKIFDSKLEINNNLNCMNIEAIKPKYNELLIQLNNNNNIDSQEEINKRLYTLIENNIKKENDWNNLTVNKNQDIELIRNIKNRQVENLLISNINFEINKIIKKKEFNKLDIESLKVIINKQEKLPIIFNKDKNTQFRIEGSNKFGTIYKNMISDENQLYIKGIKKLNNLSISKEEISVNIINLEKKPKSIISSEYTLYIKGSKKVNELSIYKEILSINTEIKKEKSKSIITNENTFYINGITKNNNLSISQENISINIKNKEEKIKPMISNENTLNIKGTKKTIKKMPKLLISKDEIAIIQKAIKEKPETIISNESQLVINGIEKLSELSINKEKISINLKREEEKPKSIISNENTFYINGITKINNLSISEEKISIGLKPLEEKSKAKSMISNENIIYIKGLKKISKFSISKEAISINSKTIIEKPKSIISYENQLYIIGIKELSNLSISKEKISININNLEKPKSLITNENQLYISSTKQLNNLSISRNTFSIDKKEKQIPMISNENQINIKGIKKLVNLSIFKEEITIKEKSTTEEKCKSMISNENQLFIKGIKKLVNKEEKLINEKSLKTMEINNEKENESQKIERIQNIDNCIQINIDRIYENKYNKNNKNDEITIKENEIKKESQKNKEEENNNKDNKESISENNLLFKDIQKSFTTLEPEEQNNFRFTFINKNNLILEIIKNEELTINKMPKEEVSDNTNKQKDIEVDNINTSSRREIKITTKNRIITKKILHKKPNNYTIVSQNKLDIEGIERTTAILEKDSQNNSQFTIEKIIKNDKQLNNFIKDLQLQKLENISIKSSKEIINKKEPEKLDRFENIDNCIQFNIERTYENKNIQLEDNAENQKNEKPKIILEKINNEEININRTPKQNIILITKNNDFCLDKTKIIPDTNEQTTDTNDLIPKEIKIMTKKVLRTTQKIKRSFNNNLITINNQINIFGKEKIKPILEKESQESNRISLGNIPEEEKGITISNNIYKEEKIENKGDKNVENIIENKEELRSKKRVPEELQINQNISYNISQDEEAINQLISMNKQDNLNKSLEIIKNNDIIIIPQNIKREIKITTKKILRTTSHLNKKFSNNKSIISLQNQFNIKGIEQNKEIINENNINIIGKEKIFDNIQIQNEEEKNNNRFTIEKDLLNKLNQIKIQNNDNFKLEKLNKDKKEIKLNINKIDSIDLQNNENDLNKKIFVSNMSKKNENVINIKTQFSINGINKKTNENIINSKSKFTINGKVNKIKENIINTKNRFTIKGIQKEEIEVKEEGIQFEDNKYEQNNDSDIETSDLIPKQIKLTTKKVIKSTNILRNKNNKNIICSQNEINIKGIQKQISSEIFNKDKLYKDIQQNKLIIKGIKIEKKTNEEKEKEINKSIIEIEKNISLNLEPIDDLSFEKNKIVNNWKNSIKEEKSEDILIEKLPPKREIKITTKKILKNTKKIYKKLFSNLSISKIEYNIEVSQKKKDVEFSIENNTINIKINKTYETKKQKEKELEMGKSEEIFINSNNYKKREIKITTKKKLHQINYIYKRFNNTNISNENQINIKGIKNVISSFGKDNLEAIVNEENKFTINNTKKEEEIKERIKKEVEEIQNKLIKENEKLKDQLYNENNELKKKMKHLQIN